MASTQGDLACDHADAALRILKVGTWLWTGKRSHPQFGIESGNPEPTPRQPKRSDTLTVLNIQRVDFSPESSISYDQVHRWHVGFVNRVAILAHGCLPCDLQHHQPFASHQPVESDLSRAT